MEHINLYKATNLAWHKKLTHEDLTRRMIFPCFPFITWELWPRMLKNTVLKYRLSEAVQKNELQLNVDQICKYMLLTHSRKSEKVVMDNANFSTQLNPSYPWHTFTASINNFHPECTELTLLGSQEVKPAETSNEVTICVSCVNRDSRNSFCMPQYSVILQNMKSKNEKQMFAYI